jgi:hypothetical protein
MIFKKRKRSQNKITPSGRKRKVLTTIALSLTLLFGKPRLTSSRSSSLNYESQAITILNQKQDSNNCYDSYNSGKVIQTGNGIILESQQSVSNTSSNDMDGIILVQGDGLLPGADGFTTNNNPRRRHPFGRPRMRGTGINVDPPQNIRGLGNIPEAPKVRGLKARRGNRGDQCPAQEKAGIDELPDSSEFIYNLEGKSAKQELRNVWKNPQAKKEVLAGLEKMNKGELVPRNQKALQGFKNLKEVKLNKTRIIVNPGKNGAPDQIVGIVMRKHLENFTTKLAKKFK